MSLTLESQAKARSFLTLDALRGVAALAVIQFHLRQDFGGLLFHHGYLAVDFFFMLSGFVLTHAYQDKLDRGWPTSTFIKTRLVRLYPLYFIGVLLGLPYVMLEGHFGVRLPARMVAELFLCGAFMLPTLHAVPNDLNIFPLNGPSWSLFGETVANIFHAVFLRRRGWPFLSVLAAIFAAVTLHHALFTGSFHFGFLRADLFFGFCRVLYSYLVGILVYKFWSARKVRIQLPAIVVGLFVLLTLAAPNIPRLPMAVNLIAVGLIFPCLLFVGASSNTSPRFARACHLLGISSYAIYILHFPLYAYFDLAWRRRAGHPPAQNAPWAGVLFTVGVFLLACALDRVYDIPVRRYLGKVTGLRRAA